LGRLAQRLFERRAQLQASLHKGTEKYDKMEDFLKRQAEMKFEAASITSLYRIRMNTTLDNGKAAFVEISLYVRCDSPRTAKVVEEIYPKLHDAILTKVQLVQESDVTTEAGKERLKAIMIEAMNSVMPAPGKILDVFFTNLIFE
jgi:flagellar basal body-associated protein FliL